MVSGKLQINFSPDNPYKLCGLKPFYGYIHKDLLEGYDFWGFGDVDVIWGDINQFYTSDILMKYDVLSTHADRLSGHLALIRNNEKYRKLCFFIKDWKQKLESPLAMALDEQDFSWLVYPQAKFITWFYGKIVRKLFNWRDAWVLYYFFIMPIFNKLMCAKKRGLYFIEQHTTPILANDALTFKHDTDKWLYHNGKIINTKTNLEHIYFHFMIYKKNGFREDYFWKEKYYNLPYNLSYEDKILIDKRGFVILDRKNK